MVKYVHTYNVYSSVHNATIWIHCEYVYTQYVFMYFNENVIIYTDSSPVCYPPSARVVSPEARIYSLPTTLPTSVTYY